jgi:peroxiredoxin family protein
MEGVLAAILESGDPERLYTGLSLLVSAATSGEPARALATFGALGALLDPDLEARARAAATHVVEAEKDAFARTLAELRDTAVELPGCEIWACAAAVQAHGADWATVGERLTGVTSTPQFLREVAGAQLVVV